MSNERATLYHIAVPKESFDWNRSKGKKADCFYLEISGERTAVWLPHSQIKERHQVNNEIHFDLPYWLIIEKRIEDYIDTSSEPTLFDNFYPSDELKAESEAKAESFNLRRPNDNRCMECGKPLVECYCEGDMF